MAKKNVPRKELLKGTDDLLSFQEKVSAFFAGHIKAIKYVGIAAGALVVFYLGVTTYYSHINKKGQQAYNEAFYMMVDQAQSEEIEAETLEKSEKQFKEVLEEHGWSKAAKLAVPQIARIKFQENKLDESIRLYKKFLDQVQGGSSNYEALARLALAACYEEIGKFEKGIDALKPVVKSPETPFKESAMLDLARLYRLDNRSDKEKEILRSFVEEYKTSPFLPLVKSRL